MMTAEAKAAWLSARCGRLTASRMADAMATIKSGAYAASRANLMRDLLAERVTGLSVPHHVNDAMEWGLEHEDEAADMFVELTGRTLRPSRFYEHPAIDGFGATPDREIDDGLLEIKCPTTGTYLAWRIGKVTPEEYKPQMCAQLLCTGKRWCGFLAYDPRITDESKRLFMTKYVPTSDELAKVEAEAIKFLSELDAAWEAFVTS